MRVFCVCVQAHVCMRACVRACVCTCPHAWAFVRVCFDCVLVLHFVMGYVFQLVEIAHTWVHYNWLIPCSESGSHVPLTLLGSFLPTMYGEEYVCSLHCMSNFLSTVYQDDGKWRYSPWVKVLKHWLTCFSTVHWFFSTLFFLVIYTAAKQSQIPISRSSNFIFDSSWP